MTRIAIAGATGVVGRKTATLLRSKCDLELVGRRVDSSLGAMSQHVLSEWTESAIAAAFDAPVDAAFCCLGTTRKKAGSAEAFRAVDFDAVIAFARATKERGAKHFVFISSIGADSKSSGLYLRTKGQAEDALRAQGWQQLSILRPGLIDDEGTRAESRSFESLALSVSRLAVRLLGEDFAFAPSRVSDIAKTVAGLLLAPHAAGTVVYEAKAIRQRAAL